MKILSLTLANTLLVGSVTAQATSFAAPSYGTTTQFQQVSTPASYQQYQPTGNLGTSFGATSYGQGQFVGGSSLGQPQLLGVSYSPYNKPGQSGSWQKGAGGSQWDSPAASVWTPVQAPTSAPAQAVATGAGKPRPPNPALSGRSPSEQLQITKCRSAQSCEKCRQLNCYWDVKSKVTNRCIALGLESTQIPVEAGQAANLGYCPTSGQQGYVGVNWLAIENSGAAVPNLDSMSDVDVQKWLSTVPNYNPDSTDSNYPAGTAFQELLPTASSAYAAGKIPSTTPWVSFFDSNLNGGAYNYDGYYDAGYSYDLPSGHFSGGAFSSGSTGWGDVSGNQFYGGSTTSFNSGFPASSGFSSMGNFGGSTSFSGATGSFGGFAAGGVTSTGFPSSYSSMPASLPASFAPASTGSFSSLSGVYPSTGSFNTMSAGSFPATSGFSGFSAPASFSSSSAYGLQG